MPILSHGHLTLAESANVFHGLLARPHHVIGSIQRGTIGLEQTTKCCILLLELCHSRLYGDLFSDHLGDRWKVLVDVSIRVSRR